MILRALVIGFLSIGCFNFAVSNFAVAKDLAGISMDDSITVDGKTLKLNGMGVRKAMGVVKVYVAGLYLENTSQNPEEILKSSGIKQLNMKFLYEVEPEKMQSAWSEGIQNNCKENCDEVKKGLEAINKMMAVMKLKDTMMFRFYADKVSVNVKGQDKGEIPGAAFSKALLAVFLGPKPPNESLKEGLLGKN